MSGSRPSRLWARRPRGLALGVVALAMVLAVLSVVRTLSMRLDLAELGLVTLVFAPTIALGEYQRFRVERGRELAPMSLAAALALSLSTGVAGSSMPTVAPAPLLIIVAVGMGLGALPHAWAGRSVHADDVAARFLGVLVCAVLFRTVPFADGRTLLSVAADWPGDRWPVALLMSAAAAGGLLTYLLCAAAVTAGREHRGLRATAVDELRSGAGMALALSSTGTLIAVAERPLGLVALPLFLVPLVLTQFALRQYAAIRQTYDQTVQVLSRITEVGGFTRAGHPDRVAALAVEIGRDLGLGDRDTRSIEYAALLHDIGQVALATPIPGGATLLAAPADQQQIASDSAEIVRKAGLPDDVAHAVDAQAVPFRVVREDIAGLPLAARILKVANAYDDLVGGSITPRRRSAAIERLQLGLGYEYDPRVVDALLRVLDRR